jgi:hypothetical protein
MVSPVSNRRRIRGGGQAFENYTILTTIIFEKGK